MMRGRTSVKSLCLLAILVACAGSALGSFGCVRRTLTIETEPSGAIVILNDREVGRSPVSTDFIWYGDYDVAVRKKDFKTIHTHIVLDAPWYQVPPMDFFADVLWPANIHDHRHASYTLEPQVLPSREELLERAGELRERALFEEQD